MSFLAHTIYQYYLKDHLGNTRVVFQPKGINSDTAIQVTEYYPFGLSYANNPQLAEVFDRDAGARFLFNACLK